PTASIDPIEESNVYRRFSEYANGRSAIVVTHRMGSARIASRIIVMKEGSIVEVGTHDELMKAGGEYARMFDLQAKWYL
ncbi:MAG: ABC transporter ATP-binding protein, partial [Clostridia bacterium]|nr:ABC transporter ATP-binding protein [Clostridia bacterium]